MPFSQSATGVERSPDRLRASQAPILALCGSNLVLSHPDSEGCAQRGSFFGRSHSSSIDLPYLPIDTDYRKDWPRWNITRFPVVITIPLLVVPTAFKQPLLIISSASPRSVALQGSLRQRVASVKYPVYLVLRPDKLGDMKAIGLRSSKGLPPDSNFSYL